jgi:hypothetical protein
LGHDPIDEVPAEIQAKYKEQPPRVYRFKAHKGDLFALQDKGGLQKAEGKTRIVPCVCPAYGFPHRFGSNHCAKGTRHSSSKATPLLKKDYSDQLPGDMKKQGYVLKIEENPGQVATAKLIKSGYAVAECKLDVAGNPIHRGKAAPVVEKAMAEAIGSYKKQG